MATNLLFLLGTFVLIVTFASFDSGQDQVQGKMTAQLQEETASTEEVSTPLYRFK